MSNESIANPLVGLSDAMAEAVAKAGTTTVMVDARKRLPASGIVFAPDLVLTADHVLERHEDILVGLPDNQRISAKFVGNDPSSDLALLRVEEERLKIAEPSLKEAAIGQIVLALGRPNSEGIQASMGVVSAIAGPVHTHHGGRLERYLRTDTIPYPGFSGGPLINASGQILGMNTSGLSRGSSITIPVSIAWGIAEKLAHHGQVRRGYLGVRAQPVKIPPNQSKVLNSEQNIGLLIMGIEVDSPAENGGILVGDILVSMAGEQVVEHEQLLSKLSSLEVGDSTEIIVLRGERTVSLHIIIGAR